MASPPSCAQAIAQASDKDNQPRSADQRDYDFVEQPSQDFFCPVTLELLLEPQLTSCCGHHLSLEASSRLQREGKACPLCNGTGWSTVLDKFHRRRVHELRVRCPHSGSGCDWAGEVNGIERHISCCPKRAWECQYCGLKCTYGEGEGEHWPICRKFPEPCPNGCEMGSVERCSVEQHRSVCSLEPVCCEMREFGCSAVVPHKDLATHMRESVLQHLTGMAVLNLHLTRQLQQDLAEKDKKIVQLQQEMAEQRQLQKQEFTEQPEMIRREMVEQRQERKEEMAELKKETMREMTELRGQVQQVHNTAQHIEEHTAGQCGLCKVFIFDKYSQLKNNAVLSSEEIASDPFYSHQNGYKFNLHISYGTFLYIGARLYLLTGEYDDQLPWPVYIKVRLELLNQAGDHHHVQMTKSWKWEEEKRDGYEVINDYLMSYVDLQKGSDGVQYMMNECLQFRLHLTVEAA